MPPAVGEAGGDPGESITAVPPAPAPAPDTTTAHVQESKGLTAHVQESKGLTGASLYHGQARSYLSDQFQGLHLQPRF